MTSDALLQAAATLRAAGASRDEAVDDAFALRDRIDQRLRAEKGLVSRERSDGPNHFGKGT